MDLKIYLESNGFSKAKIARLLKISPAYFSMIVHGHNRPSVKLAKKIEDFTEGKVTAAEILRLHE